MGSGLFFWSEGGREGGHCFIQTVRENRSQDSHYLGITSAGGEGEGKHRTQVSHATGNVTVFSFLLFTMLGFTLCWSLFNPVSPSEKKCKIHPNKSKEYVFNGLSYLK